MKQRFDLVGVGALNYDRLFRVERIASAGIEVGVKSMEIAPGGSAANTIVGLARLGARCGFIGCVGSDAEGDFILSDLEGEGVDTSSIAKKRSHTGVIYAFVDAKGERAMYAYPGANDEVRINRSNLAYAQGARYLHLSSFVGEFSFRAQRELLRKLEKVDISFAPGMLYVHRGLRAVEQLIARSKVVFVNQEEARLLTGMRYEKAALRLLKLGAEIVAVTLGRKGCFIAGSDGSWRVKAYPTKVVDTTGAGDAFAAGFLHGLLHEKSLEECGRLGNKVASLCIGEMGARKGLPYKQELGGLS